MNGNVSEKANCNFNAKLQTGKLMNRFLVELAKIKRKYISTHRTGLQF